MTDCYRCVHRRDLVGDAHSSCVNRHATVGADRVGIRCGWCFWPLNFDPVWIQECDSYSDDEAHRYTGEVGPDAHSLLRFLKEHGLKIGSI